MTILIRSTRFAAACLVSCAMILSAATAASATTTQTGEAPRASATDNPWARLAPDMFVSESAEDGDAFAGMDAVQIAALPQGKMIAWRAPATCVPGELKAVLAEVAKRYGPVTVNSTARSKASNKRAGGKSKSYHLNCRAIDFRVHGKTKGLLGFLSKHRSVGGYKRYSAGFYHIDNGPRRSW